MKTPLRQKLITVVGLVCLLSGMSVQMRGECAVTNTALPAIAKAYDPPTFPVTQGAGTLTVGLFPLVPTPPEGGLTLTFYSSSAGVVVNVPANSGTLSPVNVTYTMPPAGGTFTLLAQSTYHYAYIVVTCEALPPPPPPCTGVCVLTQGYWKNHPDNWPGDPFTSLTLGTVSYTQAQLLAILGQPVRGNGLVSLAHQLIAAKLNIARGACVPPTIASAIAAADSLIGSSEIPPIGTNSVPTSLTSLLTGILDTYNNGDTPGGPAHCD